MSSMNRLDKARQKQVVAALVEGNSLRATARMTGATRFMSDVASRLKHRVQLTTDGFKAYFDAVEDSFRGEIDYAVLQKIYGRPISDSQTRYSPAQCIGIKLYVVNGDPDPGLISTS